MDIAYFKRHAQNYPGRLETSFPNYIIVIWNKFQWMAEVAVHNPFNSEYFFWVDAGAGRWSDVAEGRQWPDIRKVKERDPDGVAIILQQGRNFTNKPFNVTNYLLTNQHFVAAGVMGATGNTWKRVAQQANDFYTKEMLQSNVVATEQHFLRVLGERNNSLISGIPRECPPQGCKAWYDRFLTVFEWLAEDTLTPAEKLREEADKKAGKKPRRQLREH